jgi:hypothetical protein
VLRFAATAAAPERFFVPAFRFRLLKRLNDLAVNLSRKNPGLRLGAPREARLHPVYFDREDAAALARFAAFELRAGRTARAGPSPLEGVEVEEADLVWIPFHAESSLYREPFTGTAVAANLLL